MCVLRRDTSVGTRTLDGRGSQKKRKSAGKTKAIARRGLMLVLSSPSGAGKTTLSRMLLKADPSVELSVSVTTRPKRADEKHGRDYRFIKKPQFEKMVEKGELLEWAEVFGNFYGTPRAPVERALAAGRDVLFDIDWQGTQQLREKVKDDVVTIFVLPPSIADLERPVANAGAGFRCGDRVADGEGGRRDEPLGRIRLRRSSTRTSTRRLPKCVRSSPPNGSSASARPDCPISSAICRRSFSRLQRAEYLCSTICLISARCAAVGALITRSMACCAAFGSR